MSDETKELAQEIRMLGFKPNEKQEYFLVGFVRVDETPLGKFNLSTLGHAILFEQTKEEVIDFFKERKKRRQGGKNENNC